MIVDAARARLDELLAAQLGGERIEDLDARTLAGKAMYRAERKAPLAAAVLFEAAAQRAHQAGDRTRWIECRVRAGTHYAEAGESARAMPILRECISAHLEHPHHRDAHMVEWCFTCLLRDARDAETFRALFAEAIRTCDAVGRVGFPKIHPHQEELLEKAHALGCVDEERDVAQKLAHRRPLSRPLRARLKALGHPV